MVALSWAHIKYQMYSMRVRWACLYHADYQRKHMTGEPTWSIFVTQTTRAKEKGFVYFFLTFSVALANNQSK